MTGKDCQTAVLLMTKDPVPGQVKTRLIPLLGEQGACNAYQQMLNLLISRLANGPHWDFVLYRTAFNGHANLQAYPAGITLKQQSSGDIGQRMYQAIAAELAHYKRVILLGADCPYLHTAHIYRTIEQLHQHDISLIPSLDGGYVLIGARQIQSGIFEDINWGKKSVFEQTCALLTRYGLSFGIQSALNDIDEPQDYLAWRAK